ncbi:uncharacterized protein Ufm1 isoform X1 [Halyomorpha halys]|uniref:uncharacterized protein Ufm1 isoform X1 n=1 Tax=Halyomorpha halys TaxID=286706 RepID=UPI0034D1E87B
MSADFESGFKEILGTIDDILSFFSLVDVENLIESDIESILFKAHYIEQFISFLKNRNFSNVFEIKLREYFEIKKIPRIPTVPVLEFFSDEVLSKILTLQLSNYLTSVAIKLYIKNASQKRFEELIKKLVKFRTLFVDVSQQLKEIVPSSEIECILLVECWLKIINGGKEGFDAVQSVLKNIFLDPESVNIFLNILCLDPSDGYLIIQEMIVDTLTSDLCEKSYTSSWKIVLEYELLESILLKFPNLLSAVLSLLEKIINGIDFNQENDNWQSAICTDLDYDDFIKIFKRLSSFEVSHYKLKRLIYLNRLKGNTIWEHVDEKCHNYES